MAGHRLGVGVVGAVARLVEEFGICETFGMARPDDVEFNAVEISHHEHRWVDLPLDSRSPTKEG